MRARPGAFRGFFEGEFRIDGALGGCPPLSHVEGEDAFPFGASCRTGCAVEVGASRNLLHHWSGDRLGCCPRHRRLLEVFLYPRVATYQYHRGRARLPSSTATGPGVSLPVVPVQLRVFATFCDGGYGTIPR